MQQKTSEKTALPKSWISALFLRFQGRYGFKWLGGIEGIENEAVTEWSEQLAGLTGEQIKKGLTDWNGDWPPSSEEFKKCCLGKYTDEFKLGYVPECYRNPPRIFDKARLLSSDERDAKRVKLAEGVAMLRAELEKSDQKAVELEYEQERAKNEN